VYPHASHFREGNGEARENWRRCTCLPYGGYIKLSYWGANMVKILAQLLFFFHFLGGALAPSNDYVASPLKGLMCFRISPIYE